MTVLFKPSRAKTLWVLVLVAVLFVLFFETRSANEPSLNVLVSGGSSLSGATVYIDGRKMGSLEKLTDSGLGGSAFWTSLPDGKYLIEVRKQGFRDFKRTIDLNTLAFVNVDLPGDGN